MIVISIYRMVDCPFMMRSTLIHMVGTALAKVEVEGVKLALRGLKEVIHLMVHLPCSQILRATQIWVCVHYR